MSRNNDIYNRYLSKENDFMTAIVDGYFPASASFHAVGDARTFVFMIFAGTLNSELVCQVKQDTGATATANIKDITGAVVTIEATDDNKWARIEVEVAKLDIDNDFNYVTLDVSGAGGGDDYLCIAFAKKLPRSAPVTQPTNLDSDVLVAG